MSNLPRMSGDRLRHYEQVRFGGLDRRPGAPDGSILNEENMSNLSHPYLQSRPARMDVWQYPSIGPGEQILDMIAWDGTGKEYIIAVTTAGLYVDEKRVLDLSPGTDRTLAGFGTKILIFPEGIMYDLDRRREEYLGAYWEATKITFASAPIGGVEAKRNCLQIQAPTKFGTLKVGDTVELSGCTRIPANNKRATIKEIRGDWLIFPDGTWEWPSETSYAENGSMKAQVQIPKLAFAFEHENRLWGATARTIFASAPGDPKNWYRFEGLDTDSWQLEPASRGKFTGGISFGGTPVFFKDDRIIRVYGQLPRTFRTQETRATGVKPGSSRSLAVAGGTLFYLGDIGVMAYRGGLPSFVGAPLGQNVFSYAAGGSDGYRYYCNLRIFHPAAQETFGRQFMFDTQTGTWCQQENGVYLYAYRDGNLHRLSQKDGKVQLIGHIVNPPESARPEDPSGIRWSVELGPFTESSPNQKGITKLMARIDLAEGASCRASVRTDGGWEVSHLLMDQLGRHDYELPRIPERCGTYWIRLEGHGLARILSITRIFWYGSERP